MKLKHLVKAAVAEAFEEQKSAIAAAVIEAIEDAGLVREMEAADPEMADPKEIDLLLRRGRRESRV